MTASADCHMKTVSNATPAITACLQRLAFVVAKNGVNRSLSVSADSRRLRYAETELAILFHVHGEVALFDKSGNRKYLNKLERMQFYRSVSTIAESEHKTFLLTLFYTGCRISEALNLSRERVGTTRAG